MVNRAPALGSAAPLRDRRTWLSPVLNPLKRALERPSPLALALFAAALAVLLTLPSLWVGFAEDDHFFLMVFKGAPGLPGVSTSPLETYSFSKGDPSIRSELMEVGLLPWWTVENWRVSFWRPLSSLSNWVDYLVFGETAWPMHLHSLLIFGVLTFLMAKLYRRLCTPAWAAALAALLFAVDSGHAIPIAWLSLRNSLLAALFGVLTLLAHDNWRRGARSGPSEKAPSKWFPHGLAALFWLCLTLLSGESGVAVGAYLFAYVLFIDPATAPPKAGGTGSSAWIFRFAKGMTTLLPYLLIVLLWRYVYNALGHGVEGSWLYIDPVSQPALFAKQLFSHMSVLLLGVFAVPDATIYGFAPSLVSSIHLAVAIVFLGFMSWVIWPLLRCRAEARFWAMGTLLATVPACATLPMDRLMTYPSMGAMAVVALFLTEYQDTSLSRRASRARRIFTGALAVLWLAIHLFISPVLLTLGTQNIKVMNRVHSDSNLTIPDNFPTAHRLIAISTPLDLLGSSLPVSRSAREAPVLRHWWWLSAGVRPVEVERVNDKTLLLRPENGFLTTPWSQIFRAAAVHPMAPGQRVSLDGLDIEVTSVTPAGRPLEARFEFDVSLEDETLHWVTWRNGAYVPFDVPAPGETAIVPGVRFSEVLPVALGLKEPPSVGSSP